MSDEQPGVGSEQLRLRVTRREQEILGLIAQGLTDQEIAERLWISIHTVHTHVAHLREKFQVPNRVVLMREAQRLGYVPPVTEKSLFLAIGEGQPHDYTQSQEVVPEPSPEQTGVGASADDPGEAEMLNPRLRFWYLAALLALVARDGAAAKAATTPRTPIAPTQRAATDGDRKTSARMLVRRVLAGPAGDYNGGLSPDGRHLSFTDWDTGDLAVIELATGKKRCLTGKGSWSASGEFAEYSTFSPDGKQLAYAWLNQDGRYELRLIGFDGSGRHVLHRGAELAYVKPTAWSPDGRHVLARFSFQDKRIQLVLVSVPGGAVRVLKTLDTRSVRRMIFSPDGRFIAYDMQTAASAPERDIYLLAVDGNREAVLVEHPADDFTLGWAPDGRHLLFSSDRTGSPGVWLLPVVDGKPTGAPKLLRPDLGRIFPLGFTRDGALHYHLTTGMIDVYTAKLAEAAGQLASPPAPVNSRFMGRNTSPAWSPDGRSLAYLSQRSAEAQGPSARVICMRNAATGEERQLAPALNLIRWITWSADGRSLLLRGGQEDRDGTYRMDVQTGAVDPDAVTPRGIYMKQSEWSPAAVFYLTGRRDTGSDHLMVRDLATGQEKELHRAVSLELLALSPDGGKLAFTASRALLVMPATGGAPHELIRLKEPETITALAWTADGRHFLIGRRNERDTVAPEELTEVWRVSEATGEPRRLGLAMKGLRQLRVHPDGRRIAFTAGASETEIWVMQNFLPAAQTVKASAPRR